MNKIENRIPHLRRALWMPLTLFFVLLCAQFVSAQQNLPDPADLQEDQNRMVSYLKGEVEPNADNLQIVGNNAILSGNVRILYQNYMILCDTAIINTLSKDIEAIGNVRFFERVVADEVMDYWKYDELLATPDIQVDHVGMHTLGNGKTMMRVRVVRMKLDWEAEHVIGNLETGTMSAKNFYCAADYSAYVRGARAERSPKGRIEIYDASMSTCPHFACCQEHYGLAAGHIVLTPQNDYDDFSEATRKNAMSLRRYWILLKDNVFLKVFGVPVAWVPIVLLPPIEEIQKYATINVGYTSQMGVKFMVGKRFQLSHDPEIYTKPLVAFFSKRGWGLGDETVIRTDESWTQITAFGMYDKKSYGVENWQEMDHESYNRFTIPHERYELRIENVTHITPRLDFRGRLEAISDVAFIGEYFSNRVQGEAQATFANLDYQMERIIPSLYVRPRINMFMPENQSLPEFRLDLPRQHVIGGLYYQGQNSVSYLSSRWRDYGYPRYARVGGNPQLMITPEEYSTFRWDTLQMFHYPIRLGWLNLIPRAGIRLTYYSQTSEQSVDQRSLQYYKWSQNPYTSNRMIQSLQDNNLIDLVRFSAYDDQGGGRFRVLGEFGIEANTKISRTWSDVKNAFWELDGLRHVFVPYVNVTCNPTNVEPDKLYFFDAVDRYGSQYYVRFGARNTLSTRRGPYYREEIKDWISLENYFDFNFYNKNRYGSIGDFATILTFTPFDKFSITSKLLLTLGDGGSYGAISDGYIKGNSVASLGAWYNTLRYELMEDFFVYLGYNYQNNYYQTPYYSMGSSLTEVMSGRILPNQYYRTNEIRGGLEFRVPYDEQMTIAAEIAYDFQASLLRDAQLRLRRNFHCWDATLTVGRIQTRNTEGGTYNDNNISFSIGLSPNPGAPIKLEAIDIYSTPYSNTTR